MERASIRASGRLRAVGDVPSLRAAAGLPTLIRASGLSQAQHWQARFSEAGHSASSSAEGLLEVAAHNGHKLGLLRQLLGEGQVADVEIQQPSLEDLYCYYMQRAESTAPAGES